MKENEKPKDQPPPEAPEGEKPPPKAPDKAKPPPKAPPGAKPPAPAPGWFRRIWEWIKRKLGLD